MKENGWTCIKINRKENNNRRLGTGNSKHISENELDFVKDEEWDYIIDNNGSLQDLFKQLDKIIENKKI
jgi:dephospho-CoA kinase